MRGSRMQCSRGVWYLVFLLVSVLADEDREKQAKIGVNDEEGLPISEHEYPRENIPTRPDYRGPGHWATPAPDSGIKLGFIPIKTYAQVRRSISVKHLPRSDALASATTAEEKLNAPRLREVVTTKKISEVYTEEGYEDSAYDHGGYKKEQAKQEDYVKPAASSHHDSVAQGTNAVPKPGLPPNTWERHKVIRNETRMMFLGDDDGKETVPMKVVASYSHTIQHPGGNGDIIESGSVNMPSNRRLSTNRRSSKVPRSSPHYTENLAIPLMSNDASALTNHQLLLRNRHSEVSHPTMVQNYPAVIMQHNSDESNHQLLLRNQQPLIDYSSLMQNPAITGHPAVASNAETLPLNSQNLPLMYLANDPLQQESVNLPLNQNQLMSLLQGNPRVKPNARPPENFPTMMLPGNAAESQHVKLLQQISDDSQAAFLSLSQPRTQSRGSTRLTLVNNNNPSATPGNQPREVEVSLHYQTPPVIIEEDTPSPTVPRFQLPLQQRFQIHPRKLITKPRDDFLSPPPQYQLTSRELVAFAKSNKNVLKSKTTLLNEITAPQKPHKIKNKVEPSENSTKATEEKKDHTTERTIITNGHLPWGVIANEGRKIPVSKLIPLKDASDEDESSLSSNNSPSSISKIIKPSKVEDISREKTQKKTKTATDAPTTRLQKTTKHMKVSDPRKNDTYSNEQPHLAKFVEALTLAHYAPNNEHTRNVAFKSSGRKHNTAKYADRNKDLQDMLAKVYENKQKSIQTRGRSMFSETRPSNYRRTNVRHGTQVRQPQVEHRVYPDNDAQRSMYDGVRNINVAVNRAPRISRKADTNFPTKDVKYLSGAKEEDRLKEEERLLEEEKDTELEENVAQWKQAILEIDNPKPEVDTKKYPFYYAPVTKSISPYSPLRYATNPKDVPKKTEGGMEFYESREKVRCPEVVGKLDIAPKRAKSGEWNKKPKAKLPRLRGLEDKIDCLKTKYFGEEPLDNPFFKETTVALPKSTSNRRVERVSDAEDEIESDPLGLYADILKHVQSIGNSGNFPLHSSSNHKNVRSKQKINPDSASSNRSPGSVGSYSSGEEKSPPKASNPNTQESSLNRPHAETHRKTKNRNLESPDAPRNKVNNEHNPPRTKRPLPNPHRQHPPYKQHPRIPKVQPEQSKRVKENNNPHKNINGNIEFHTGFRPLILNPERYQENSPEQRQKAHTNAGIHNNPIDRPHGVHYGVSPHPYKIVSPAENGSVEVKLHKDYNDIIGMQPPPVQKHRDVLKTVHRKPKEYPTSITEMLPSGPKLYPAPPQRAPLKRFKGVPEFSPPPLQYHLSPDGRVLVADVISANEGLAIGHGLGTLLHQNVDEMLASESATRNTFQQPAEHVRTKRSSKFSEEIFPTMPLDVNDAAPILQRRQDHVVVDRLGNMYYGHVNGDDAFWTTTGNDIEPNKEGTHTREALQESNEHDSNHGRREELRHKTHDGEDIDSSHSISTKQPKPFDARDGSATSKKPNYDSIISLNTGQGRFSLSNDGKTTAGSKQDSSKEVPSSISNHSNGEEVATNSKKGLPLTEAQSTPEVLSPEQINRILSGIMSRHSYSSRYRSEEGQSTTTTSTTTEKPSTTSPRSTTKSSRKRPSKKQRVIPILSGRVVPELVTSTTKSPEIRKSRRRLPSIRIEATTATTATTESTIRGTDRRQRQRTSHRGKSPREETSTASPNTRSSGTHRRRANNGRENKTNRKLNTAIDKDSNGNLRATVVNKLSNGSHSERIANPQHLLPKTSHKVSRTAVTTEPDSTTVPPQRVQAIETRRVTKEEIYTTRYYPEHAEDGDEDEETPLRDSKLHKREDEDNDGDDDKEIYEPYATQHFHSGNRRNALNHDHWNGKSKVIDKNSANLDMEEVRAPIYHSSEIDELEITSVKSPVSRAEDKDDATPTPHTIFPQDREEFKDVTVLTYMVDPNTGVGKWIPGIEDSDKRPNNRESENTHSKKESSDNSDTEHERSEESESDAYYSEVRHPQEEDPSTSSHTSKPDPAERIYYYHTSSDEEDDYILEDDDNSNHETNNKKAGTKLKKVLQQVPKEKLLSKDEDSSSLQDDKPATDLYVLVSLLPSSEETTKQPVKYVKHPGERKYYYVQDYIHDDSTNES